MRCLLDICVALIDKQSTYTLTSSCNKSIKCCSFFSISVEVWKSTQHQTNMHTKTKGKTHAIQTIPIPKDQRHSSTVKQGSQDLSRRLTKNQGIVK